MKKLERNEMKNLKGGIVVPPPSSTWGACGATITCQNGSTISYTCEGFDPICVGNDYGSPNGYPGGINYGSITCDTGLQGSRKLTQVTCQGVS